MCFSYCVWCARIKAEIFLPVRGMNNSYSCQANPSGAEEVGTRPSWRVVVAVLFQLLTNLHNVVFSAQQGLQNVELKVVLPPGLCFYFSAVTWMRQEEKLGLIPLKSLQLIYRIMHLKVLLCNVKWLLPILAKASSIYNPSCLSPNASNANADKEEGHCSNY